MNRSFILVNHMRFILFGGVMAGMAGMVHAQSPRGGQVGGIGTGGASAGQLPSDSKDASAGQGNTYGSPTIGRSLPDSRNGGVLCREQS